MNILALIHRLCVSHKRMAAHHHSVTTGDKESTQLIPRSGNPRLLTALVLESLLLRPVFYTTGITS